VQQENDVLRVVLVIVLILIAALVAGVLLVESGDPDSPLVGPARSSDLARAEPPKDVERGDGEPPSDAGRVIVRGVVLDARDGLPIVGAAVSVNPWLETHQTTTDERGEWRLVIPPDRARRETGRVSRGNIDMTSQRLAVRADGFAEERIWFDAPAGPVPVSVRPVYLTPIAGTVSGRVVDAASRPVADLPILVGDVIRTTDVKGRFGPEAVVAGKVRVECRQTAKDVLVSDGEEVEIELVVGPQLFAKGRVVDDAGSPVAGVTIWRFKLEDFPVETDEDGRFVWPTPFGQGELLEAVKEGYSDPEFSHRVEGNFISIVLHRSTPLEGRVVRTDGETAAGLRIVATHWRSTYASCAFVDSTGEFSVGASLAGTWTLNVLRGSVPLGAFPVDVALGEPRRDLVLRLAEPKIIRFEVLDALTEAPLEGAKIGPWPDGDAFTFTATDGTASIPMVPTHRRGYFRITLAGYEPARHSDSGSDLAQPQRIRMEPLGAVHLRVLDAIGEPVPGALVRSGHDWLGYSDAHGVATVLVPAGKQVELRVDRRFHGEARVSVCPVVGETLSAGDVWLPPLPTDLTIIVVDEAGAPIPGASVEGQHSGPNTSWRTDEDGRVSIRRRDVSSRWIEVTARGFECRGFELPKEGDELKISLRRCARARGRVLDSRGKPVVGLSLSAYHYDVADTDGAGRFEIVGVPYGKFVPVGLHGAYMADGWGLVMAGGEESEIRIPGTGEIRIRVGSPPEDQVSLLETKVRTTILLLDRKDLDHGGPIRIGGDDFSPRGRWKGEHLRYVAPAGRILVRFSLGEAGESLLGPVDLSEGGTVELTYRHPEPGRTKVRFLHPDGKPVTYGYLHDAHGGDEVATTDGEGWMEPWPHSGYPSGARRFRIDAWSDAPLVTDTIDMDAGGEVLVRLRPGGGIAGTVHRMNGRPAAGARVAVLLSPGPFERVTQCDDKGRFEFPERVGTGARMIEVRADAGPPVRRQLKVKAGQVTRVDITFPR
jgi:Carboxypeptidase regulatory-like domain